MLTIRQSRDNLKNSMKFNLKKEEAPARAKEVGIDVKAGVECLKQSAQAGFASAKDKLSAYKSEVKAEAKEGKKDIKEKLKDMAQKGLGVAANVGDFISDKARQGAQALNK